MPEDVGSVGLAEVETSTSGMETGSVEESAPQQSQDAINSSDTSQEKEGLTQKSTPKSQLRLEDVVKTKSDALKAIDPNLPAAIRVAAFEQGRLYKEFPGGLKEAVAAKQALSEIGGADGAKELRDAVGDYSKLEQLFEAGDGAFLKQLADSEPVAFASMMPAGLEYWKNADPEGYNHAQARVMIQTLDANRVSTTLEQIWNSLDAEKQAPLKDAIAALWQTIDGYRKAADKAPERKVDPKSEALTRREQELAQRELRAVMEPVANEGKQQISSIIDREMTANYQWSATNGDVKQAVNEQVQKEIVKASQKDKTFCNELERLKARGDRSGLARHIKNFQERVGPGIVQRVARLYALKPKNAGTQTVKKPVAQPASGGRQEQGWERVMVQPKASQLDYAAMGRNAEDMIMSGKAILKGGKKVQWS